MNDFFFVICVQNRLLDRLSLQSRSEVKDFLLVVSLVIPKVLQQSFGSSPLTFIISAEYN